MQWVYAVFGIVMIAMAVMSIYAMSDGVRAESRMSLAGAYVFLALFLGIGLWLSWPLFAVVVDLVRGTDTARAVVRAREVSQSVNVRAELQATRWFVDRAVMVGGVAAPFLWWGMRAREPAARRQWVVLTVGVLGGVLAFAHYAPATAAAVPVAGPMLGVVGGVMERHELGSVLGLSWVFVWLGALASSTWTGCARWSTASGARRRRGVILNDRSDAPALDAPTRFCVQIRPRSWRGYERTPRAALDRLEECAYSSSLAGRDTPVCKKQSPASSNSSRGLPRCAQRFAVSLPNSSCHS